MSIQENRIASKAMLNAISPLDGRYHQSSEILSPYMSEYGLIRYRVIVEVSWLKALNLELALTEKPQLINAKLDLLHSAFDVDDALKIKALEKTTNHDVKAVEYWIKERLTQLGLDVLKEYVHFACTSEDINNVAYALMIKAVNHTLVLPLLERLIDLLSSFAIRHADTPMLAKTHGQAATPTTLGKEFANIVVRLKRQYHQYHSFQLQAKMNGAVGNFNAHVFVFPDLNWPQFSRRLIESLELGYNTHTTQIEPHDTLAELFHILSRFTTILIDSTRDIWQYISQGYFRQKVMTHEVGSSTMPHKVNPIDFENAEGNLGISQVLFNHFANKLPISRLQRDLSDSTVLRNCGTAFGYFVLSINSMMKGLEKLEANAQQLTSDLAENWAVLAEPIQMIMRVYRIDTPYEKLKALTRGQAITQEILHQFIATLKLPKKVKEALMKLTPSTYLGLAATLSQQV